VVTASAPGRVNLMGDHTDYNDGYVLPAAIRRTTTVTLVPANDDDFVVTSRTVGRSARFRLDAPPDEPFARYVYGCIREVVEAGFAVPPVTMDVRSDVPMGIGLSSSAALEIATLRALRTLLDLPLDDVALARMAQRAENLHAGVACGILDQMASSLAPIGAALFLDVRTLDHHVVPLPAGSEIVVLDSGASRSLAATGYNTRRAECEEAARRLGVPALRDATLGMIDDLPQPLRGRVRHVVTENVRVLEAASGVDAATFGGIMRASHASLRDDYESSAEAVDVLVDALCEEPAIFGARITGGGFGGACVALARAGEGGAAATRALARVARPDRPGRIVL
jgi:galactokinase